jgi:DNA-binding IclR family transcriptional regulator
VKLIQSVQRAVQILDVVSQSPDGLRLKEVAEQVGLGSTTVHNILNTLCELGLIRQSHTRYQLGVRTLQIGSRYLDGLSLYEIAFPVVKALNEEYNESFFLVALEDGHFTFLVMIESTQNVKATRVASDLATSHATAIGKVLLSSLDPETLHTFIRKNKLLQRFTPNTITTEKALQKELECVRKSGYALDREEMEIGLSCISVPIRSHRGEIVAALGTGVPVQRFTPQTIDEILQGMIDSAARISAELGYSGQDQTGNHGSGTSGKAEAGRTKQSSSK